MGEEAEKKPDTGAVEHINLKVVGQVIPPLAVHCRIRCPVSAQFIIAYDLDLP